MRWEDERYVRVYTRDTVDWQFLSFEAQGLFTLLLRKVDRAGILKLGRHHPGKAVAAAIGHPSRWEAIQAGLDELVADRCVVINDGVLVVRNFLEAQEAKQSDKARQAKARELARDAAAAESVTLRDEPSRFVTKEAENVTHCHTVSHGVTPSRAVPSLPSRAVPETTMSAEPTGLFELKPTEPPPSKPAVEVFEHWREIMGKGPRAVFDDARRGAVEARLAEGYTVDELKRAIEGCASDPFNMGKNDRKKRYDDLELICRKAAHVDRYMSGAPAPSPDCDVPGCDHAAAFPSGDGFTVCDDHRREYLAWWGQFRSPDPLQPGDFENFVATLPRRLAS